MKLWEKILVFAITPLLGLAVWSALYVERGWLRSSFIPAYASFAYKNKVHNAFDEVFYPVNTKLATYGFTSGNKVYDECWKGGNAEFEGFSERVPCVRSESLNFPTYSKSFESRWQKGEAFSFDRFMKSEGWTYISPNQPLLQMYASRGDDKTLDIQYLKRHHGVTCTFMLIYYSWENDSDKTWANESCQKDLVILDDSYY